MKKITLRIFIILCAFTLTLNVSNLFAQTPQQLRCGTDEYMELLKTQDPGLQARMDAIEQQTREWMNNHPNERTSSTVMTIPVVVHVVYNTAAQNISDDMVKSQIDVINEDWGGYNSDVTKMPPFFKGVKAGDTGMRFCLASRDPSGNPTNGIRHVSTSVTSFSGNAIKFTSSGGDDAWPCGSYMNIWVGNLSGGLLGYAQLPGGACNTDGVVIQYNAFGRISTGAPYNYGRTVTHEFSHCFNLRHIWGDANCGNDFVADTPTQQAANFGCPSCHGFTCSNQPTGDMYMNFMDYTDDKCMYMFSAGQAARMLACMNTTRLSLQSSLGCTPPSLPAVDAGISEIITPTGISCDNTTVTFLPEITIQNFGSTALTSATINYKIDNGTTQTQSWTGTLATGLTANVTLSSMTSTAGDHMFYCWTSNPNGTTDATPVNDRMSRNFIGHPLNTAYPLSQGFETLPFPPANWSNRNYDCGTGWNRTTTAFHSGVASAYFNNFSATATQNGVMDELTTQPIDMTNAPANATLNFWKAYAPKSATGFDTLEIFASTDCGDNFTSIFKDWGTTLATAPATTSVFTPTSSQWSPITVSLASYVGQKNLVLVFRNRNHGGNNLYIDDININTLTGISITERNAQMVIYPSPSTGMFNIKVPEDVTGKIQINIYSNLGVLVYSEKGINQNGLMRLNLNNVNSGIYSLNIISDKFSKTEKIIIQK